jgi:hypothetical protein
MSLTALGAGMLASRSPFPGVALGEGLETAIKVAQSGQTRETQNQLAEARAGTAQMQAQHLVDWAGLTSQRLGDQEARTAQTEDRLNQAQRDRVAQWQTMTDQRDRAQAEREAAAAALQQAKSDTLQADIARWTQEGGTAYSNQIRETAAFLEKNWKDDDRNTGQAPPNFWAQAEARVRATIPNAATVGQPAAPRAAPPPPLPPSLQGKEIVGSGTDGYLGKDGTVYDINGKIVGHRPPPAAAPPAQAAMAP